MWLLKNLYLESAIINPGRQGKVRLWLIAGSILMLAGQAPGQALTDLHGFSPLNTQFLNADGAYPVGGLVLLNNTLYGTSSQGGMAAGGTIFKVNTDGSGFAVIYNFTPPNPNAGTAGDGAYPRGNLIVATNALYGTTSAGGAGYNGTVFRLNTDGSGFTTLHTFSASAQNSYVNSDGAAPWSGLVLSGSTLYGTATRGGDSGSGTVFKLNTDGTGFMRLHSFSALDSTTQTNNDGAYPLGGLVLADNTLYGATYRGGGLASGTVFRMNTDGTAFTVLHDSDGGPRAALLLVSNVLYGTAEGGGSAGGGTVFKLNTDGTGFTNLENFAGNPGNGPWGGLMLSGSTLYGTTFAGGDAGQGSIFALHTDGTGFTNLYSFSGAADGAQPQDTLLSSGDVIYGTASAGGDAGSGTVFALSLSGGNTQTALTINISGADVILTWPASSTGLTLESATNLVPPVVWAPVLPGPTVVNGQNTVTNPITGPQVFYRLAQ